MASPNPLSGMTEVDSAPSCPDTGEQAPMPMEYISEVHRNGNGGVPVYDALPSREAQNRDGPVPSHQPSHDRHDEGHSGGLVSLLKSRPLTSIIVSTVLGCGGGGGVTYAWWPATNAQVKAVQVAAKTDIDAVRDGLEKQLTAVNVRIDGVARSQDETNVNVKAILLHLQGGPITYSAPVVNAGAPLSTVPLPVQKRKGKKQAPTPKSALCKGLGVGC